jgi:hypothetical protein
VARSKAASAFPYRTHSKQRPSIGRAGGLAKGDRHPTGTEYFIVPGGPIPRDVGDELITMPDIRPVDSALFPGSDGQTWERVR